LDVKINNYSAFSKDNSEGILLLLYENILG